MKQQKWYQSKIALGVIMAQIITVVALFASADVVNIVQVVGAAVITILVTVGVVNNPTNPAGWGANEEEKK